MNPLALIVLGVIAAASQRSSAPAGSGPAGPSPATRPTDAHHASATAYARGKLPMLSGRWDNARLRAALERFAPQYLPGAPLAAVFALGASSTGQWEQVPAGLWGVERSRLAAWSSDAETLRVLGRAFTLPGYPQDLEAQAFTGCRRYCDAWRDAVRVLGQLVATSSELVLGDVAWVSPLAMGPWEYQCAVAAYSSGAGALAALVRPHVDALRAAPRASRFSRLAELVGAECVAAGAQGRVSGLPVSALVGAAWTVTRPRERYESGRALQGARGPLSDSSWFSDPGPSSTIGDQLSTFTHS